MNITSRIHFRDLTFRKSDWIERQFVFHPKTKNSFHDSTGKFSVDRVGTGGLKGGPFRQCIHQWSSPKRSRTAYMSVVHMNIFAVVEPTLVSNIHSFDVSFNLISIIGDICYAIVIEQGNRIFMGSPAVIKHKRGEETQWKNYRFMDLRLSDFKLLTKDSNEEITSPDFNDMIRFGYMTLNSSRDKRNQTVSGISTFEVVCKFEGNLSRMLSTMQDRKSIKLSSEVFELKKTIETQKKEIKDLSSRLDDHENEIIEILDSEDSEEQEKKKKKKDNIIINPKQQMKIEKQKRKEQEHFKKIIEQQKKKILLEEEKQKKKKLTQQKKLIQIQQQQLANSHNNNNKKQKRIINNNNNNNNKKKEKELDIRNEDDIVDRIIRKKRQEKKKKMIVNSNQHTSSEQQKKKKQQQKKNIVVVKKKKQPTTTTTTNKKISDGNDSVVVVPVVDDPTPPPKKKKIYIDPGNEI